jgi:uncharacterized membrane protein YdjX (TVP38/TMEM64 family)
MSKQGWKRLIVVGAICILFGVLFMMHHAWGCFDLEHIKMHSNSFKAYVTNNFLLSMGIYFVIYASMISLGIPGIAPLTMLSGFLFGIIMGFLVAIVAALVGSLIYFFVMRYILKRFVRNRYATLLERFNAQMEHYGVSYILMLHYSSVVPFFVINTLAALADLPLATFIWSTVAGSAPIILIYTFAGQQLSLLRSIRDIFSPTIILMLLLLVTLSVVPIFIKKVCQLKEP